MPSKCEHNGCTKQPYLNFKGQKKRIFCSQHTLPGMVDVANKQCEHNGCTKQPYLIFFYLNNDM